MILKSTGGSLLEMTVVGYEFPECETQEYDSNWLRIKIEVAHPKGRWSSVDPSLLTSEVEHLAQWLEAVANGRKVDESIDFTEPNLAFRLGDLGEHGKALRVYFELESRPPWSRSTTAGEGDIWLEFPVRELDLQSAARQLRTELQKYPQRAAV